MFHLRFGKTQGSRDIELNLSCRHYQLMKDNSYVVVHLYDRIGSDPIASVTLSPNAASDGIAYSSCFVMEAGKTIDKITFLPDEDR